MSQARRPRGLEDWLDVLADKVPPLRTFSVRDPGIEQFQRDWINDYAVVRALINAYFRVDVQGAENLPREGAALLVGNHGRTGLDAFIFAGVAPDHLGRHIRALADRRLFRVPGFRDWIAAAGAVQGTRENALTLLGQGELVLVYPGGNREVMKRAEQAYQLIWGDRTGFVRVALEAGVDIYPVAGIGVEELYNDMPGWDQVEQSRLMRLVDQVLGPRLGPRPPPPVVGWGLGPLPVPAKLTFKIGPAISLNGLSPDRPEELLEFQQDVRRKLERMIDEGLAERNLAPKEG